MDLRPYQEDCVNAVLSAYENDNHGYEIIVLPTGAGKTICFSYVIHELQKKQGVNALIIAHRDELLNQAADKYRMINPSTIIGKIGSGVHEHGGEVTVASIQTISRPNHIKKLQAIGYGIVIVDEAHHIMSKSYQRVLEALPDAFVLGVTATPERLDKKDIFKGGEPLYQTDIISMVKQGYLCDIRAIAIQTEVNLDTVRRTLGDFNEKELDQAVNIPKRNELIVSKYLEHTNGKRAACFCVSIDHAETMCEAFNAQGVPSAVIKGDTPIEERQRIYKAFDDGEILVLCSVMVLSEGWDSPKCEIIIMARPTQSRSLYIQMFGRGLRPAPNKQECILLDITDNCTKHKLAPQRLKTAIKQESMRNAESLLACKDREEKEQEERIQKLKEKREHDVVLTLIDDQFAKPLTWQEKESGVHLLEICPERHQIALVPSASNPSLFYIEAKLAPLRERQRWTPTALPFEWAKIDAEKKARILLSGDKYLIDKYATWRSKPASEGQLKMLRFYGIRTPEGMTSGQASDLIEAHKASIAHNKYAKEAREKKEAAC